jgi:DNA-binding CsgD family transcriptional regulator
VIPYRHNQLKFAFSANDYENPQGLEFSTYLDKFDDDWSPWNNRSSREFTNLKYGEHTFKVKARNIFGTESNISAIYFEIGYPWYLRWWAYGVYFILFASLMYLLGIYIRHRMEKSKREEEARQKQQFKELEENLRREALEAEKEVIRLRNEKLNAEMKLKDKELANNTMQMIQKSKSLTGIKKELSMIGKQIRDQKIKDHLSFLIRKINREIDTENQWKVFEESFENVHDEFLNRLKSKYPDLSPREMKLCAYLRLNISSKEIATLMNISTRGVEISRYRLRKKLGISHETNLTQFIMSI